MIKKITIGSPFETEAIINFDGQISDTSDYGRLSAADGFEFSYHLNKKDIVYGLGETIRGINKRGWIYVSDCTDDPVHTEDKTNLYGAHNFIVIDGKETFGLYFDYPAALTFDIGYTDTDELKVTAPDADINVYQITGSSIKDIVKQFRKIIGQSYIPPEWAFGFQQSRWGYVTEKDFLDVAHNYRKNNIPLDSICMDIDYMDDYMDFTVDEKKFPHFEKLVSDLKDDGIRLVPIIDAGVKIKEDYDVYREGVENNYFCKRQDGSDFVAGVWPGHTHFPDFLNSDARKWFGNKYAFLIDKGIEGFWNDMNEPSIFYSEEGIKEFFDLIDEYKKIQIDVTTYAELKRTVNGLQNNPLDYRRFYHNVNGQKIRHDKVHNLYGFNMTRSASEAFDTIAPEKRILMYSRSSCVGMHRYGGVWTGDNKAWWSHILMNIKMMPSMNMCGFLYTGADIGGFGNNTTRDLLLRWLALGIFTPLMRNHSARNTRLQECYQFGDTEDFRNIVRLRYRLIPYLYSEYIKSAVNYEMMIRPLSFDFTDDEMAKQIEDQLMIGSSIMIAPIYTQNATGRYVYLPEDMLFVKFITDEKYTTQVLEKGHHYINVEINEVPVFIRKDCFLPLCRAECCTGKLDTSDMQIIGYVTGKSEYTLYEDDGFSKNYTDKRNYHTITVNNESGNFSAQCGGKTFSAIDITQV